MSLFLLVSRDGLTKTRSVHYYSLDLRKGGIKATLRYTIFPLLHLRNVEGIGVALEVWQGNCLGGRRRLAHETSQRALSGVRWFMIS